MVADRVSEYAPGYTMPAKPIRACTVCGRLGCPEHAARGWDRIEQPARIRGRRLQALRARLFAEHPLCVLCAAQGRTTAATIRDHVIPLAEGGTDDERNVQALCTPCSDAKTAGEAARGVRRSWGGGRP